MLEKTEQLSLIKALRDKTLAGMNDCKSALLEAEWDFDKAQDLVKARGLAQNSRNASKVASEGALVLSCNMDSKRITCLEVNCNTDFTARSQDFTTFIDFACIAFACIAFDDNELDLAQFDGDLSKLKSNNTAIEALRQDLMSKTKENIVVRRWFREEVFSPNCRVFGYLHNNQKLASLVSIEAPSLEAATNEEFLAFGHDVAMQIAAMNPIAISLDQVPQAEKDRQKAIFETQLKEANKPEAQWEKIITGKFNKWASENTLLKMESVLSPKTSIETLANNLSKKLCGEEGKIIMYSMQRIVLGEGIDKPVEEDYAQEIAKMTGVSLEKNSFNSELHTAQLIHNGGEQLDKPMDVFKGN